MHLYSGTSVDFIDQAQRNLIASRLSDRFFEQLRYRPSDSEVRSWQNSLTRMATVMELGTFTDQGVIVEYQLPLTSKRLDVMLTGHGAGGIPGAAIVELKQWDRVEPSPILECVATFVGGRVRDVLHPSHQSHGYRQYLVDNNTAFSDGQIVLRSCSYLHNLKRQNSAAIFEREFQDIVALCPSFTLDDLDNTNGIIDFLQATIGEGGGAEPLRAVLEGRHRPHRRLLEHTAQIIRNEPAFTLLDEQKVAFNDVLGRVRNAQLNTRQTSVIIHGGPGTGKSLIAVNLLAELSSENFVAIHATGSKAFTENLRKVVGKRASAQFEYFNSFAMAEPLSIDLLVCDEAHRIRETSNNRFTKKDSRSEKRQVEELMDVSKVAVFLLDDLQVVRPGEVGSSDLIRAVASEKGIELVEHQLEAQFRCNGSDSFIQWVDNTLSLRRTPQVLWEMDDPFDFDVLDSPYELDAIIRSKSDEGFSARLTAGFCWPWSNPMSDGQLVADVKIDDWAKAWNAKPDAGRLASNIPKSNFWASDPAGIDQVGCIYTAQGFEFEYVGVIWGPDLVYRAEGGWQGRPEFSHDAIVRRSVKTSEQSFTNLLKNTYRVLLTRGLRGCYVTFTDRETRDFVLSRTERWLPPMQN